MRRLIASLISPNLQSHDTRNAIAVLDGKIDANAVTAVWGTALQAT
jgi:hypothetical protein